MLFRETLRSGEDVPVNSSLKKLMGATADEAEGIQSKRRWPLPAANQHLWSCSWACCASWPCLGRKIERAQGISRHLKAWPMPGLRNCFLDSVVCYVFWCVCVLGTFQHSFFIKKNIPTTWTPPCPIWVIHGLSQNWVRNTKQSSNHHLVLVDPSFPQVLWQVPTVKMVTGLPPYLGMMCRSRSWKPFLGDDPEWSICFFFREWLETRKKNWNTPQKWCFFLWRIYRCSGAFGGWFTWTGNGINILIINQYPVTTMGCIGC